MDDDKTKGIVKLLTTVFIFSLLFYSFVIYVDSKMNSEKLIINDLSLLIQEEQKELMRLLVFPYTPQLEKYIKARSISNNQFILINKIKILKFISSEARESLITIEQLQFLKNEKNTEFDEINHRIVKDIKRIYKIDNPINVDVKGINFKLGKEVELENRDEIIQDLASLVIYIQMFDRLLASATTELNRQYLNIENQTQLIVAISQIVSIIIFLTALTLILLLTLRYSREKKRSQNQLKNIIESMKSSLIVIDGLGQIIVWNNEAQIDSKLTASDVIGQYLHEISYIFDKEMVHDILDTVIHNDSIWKKERLTIHEQSRGVIYKDVSAFPLINSSTPGVVIRIDDVTERVMMEKVMIQSEKMVTVGSLAAGIAHEVNNPLAGIIQSIQVVLNRLNFKSEVVVKKVNEYGIDEEKLERYLNERRIFEMLTVILNSGKRAASIVRNMLSFSRKSEHERHFVDIKELADDTVNLVNKDYNLKKNYDFRDIKIEKEYDQEIPEFMCNRGEIEQVLLNLFKNAAQAMGEANLKDRKPEIKIVITKCNKSIEMEISDNGPGMSIEIKDHIFEPFYTTKKEGSGTGLGLYICYLIITEKYGGDIEVRSEEGKGTTFKIILPTNT